MRLIRESVQTHLTRKSRGKDSKMGNYGICLKELFLKWYIHIFSNNLFHRIVMDVGFLKKVSQNGHKITHSLTKHV